MSDFGDLMAGVLGNHRVEFIAEEGEFGARCVACSWTYHTSVSKDRDPHKFIGEVILAGILHSATREGGARLTDK